jgi:hypothetical protein
LRKTFANVSRTSREIDVRVSANNRSKISNGTNWQVPPRFGGPDLRKPVGRRWRDLFIDFSHEFTAAAGRAPTVAEASLIRSCADLALAHERLSGDVAAGRAIETDELNRISGNLRRTLLALRLTGGAHDAAEPGPTLADLLAEHGKR